MSTDHGNADAEPAPIPPLSMHRNASREHVETKVIDDAEVKAEATRLPRKRTSQSSSTGRAHADAASRKPRDESMGRESDRTVVGEDLLSSRRYVSRSRASGIEQDPEKRILVEFGRDDAEDPFAFSFRRKLLILFTMDLVMFWASGLGTLYAAIVDSVADDFQVSPTVARIPLSMFLLGFSIGPVFLTPLAEDYGRKPVITACMILVYVFQIPCALAQNIGTLIVCRLLSGIFAAPIFTSVSNIPDLWHPRDHFAGWALNSWTFIAEAVTLHPLMGAAINHHLGWRWVFWFGLIVGFGLIPIYFLFVPETRQGPILTKRAKRLRTETGNKAYYAEHEIIGRRTWREVLHETVLRPAYMLFTEPIVFYFAVFDGFNYAIIYLVVDIIPLIYGQWGFNDVQSNLVFLSFIIGYLLTIFVTYPIARRATRRIERERGGDCPEAKLWWLKFAGVLFPLSLYWLAATSRPPVPWIVSALAYGFFASSSHVIFFVVSDYTVEAYGPYASSAVTGQSFLREALVAAMALIAVIFYENVGGLKYFWPTMILAFIATPMALIPFIFDRYGPEIRRRSAFAQTIRAVQGQQRTEHDALESLSESKVLSKLEPLPEERRSERRV